MNGSTCREKTLREYIYDLGNKEIVHDYEAETKRIVDLFDKYEKDIFDRYEHEKYQLRNQIERMETIIYVLSERIRFVDSGFIDDKRS